MTRLNPYRFSFRLFLSPPSGGWGVLILAATVFPATLSLDSLAVRSGKYLIIPKPLSIASGDTLVIGQGSEVLFPPFSGITVSGGVLKAQGTRTAPVFFSSIRDTNNSAAAFDWLGVDIKHGSSAHLSFCAVSYSSSGITSEDSLSLILDSCIFYANGQWALSLAGTISQIPDSLPFSYAVRPLPVISTSEPPSGGFGGVGSGGPAQNPEVKIALKTKILVSVGIISVVAGSYFFFDAKTNSDNYNSFVPGNPAFDNTSPQNRQTKFDTYRDNYKQSAILSGSCFSLAVLDGLWLLIRNKP